MYKRDLSALRRFRRVHEFLTTNVVDGTQVKLQVLASCSSPFCDISRTT